MLVVNFHTLRHTAASHMVQNGVDLITVQEICGWSSLKMLERYAHTAPGKRQEAVAMMDGILGHGGGPRHHEGTEGTVGDLTAPVPVISSGKNAQLHGGGVAERFKAAVLKPDRAGSAPEVT